MSWLSEGGSSAITSATIFVGTVGDLVNSLSDDAAAGASGGAAAGGAAAGAAAGGASAGAAGGGAAGAAAGGGAAGAAAGGAAGAAAGGAAGGGAAGAAGAAAEAVGTSAGQVVDASAGAVAGAAAGAASGGAAGASAAASTESPFRALSAAAAASSAIAAAIAGGVSLRGSSTDRSIASIKKQLSTMGAPLIATLISQAQDLAERDVAGALQSMKQVVDILGSTLSPATLDAKQIAKIAATGILTKSLPGIVVQPLIQSDMVTMGQALIRLENALARQQALAASRAVQRARVTFDRNVTVLTFKSTTIPLVALR